MWNVLVPIWLGVQIMGIATGLGAILEKAIKPEPRETVRRLIQPLTKRDLRAIADSFIQCFDSLFEPSRTGLPRLRRSILASCLALAIISTYWWLYFPERVRSTITFLIHSEDAGWFSFPAWAGITTVASFAIIINIIGDIFSMWETRFVLGRLANRQSLVGQVTLLIGDIIATIAIYFVGLLISAFLLEWITQGSIDEPFSLFTGLLLMLFDMLLFKQENIFGTDLLIIFLYTSMFTSIWLWLFMLGIKFIHFQQMFLRPFARVLDWNNYPIIFVGIAAGALTGTVAVIVGWTVKLISVYG